MEGARFEPSDWKDEKLVEKLEKKIVPGVVILTSGTISTGFESFDLNLLVISAIELFSSRQ